MTVSMLFQLLTHFGCDSIRIRLLQPCHVFHRFFLSFSSEELFYQRAIADVTNYGVIKIQPPRSIQDLAEIALRDFQAPTQGDPEEVHNEAALFTATLLERTTILKEFFNIEIDKDGFLHTIPALMQDFTPAMMGLPKFIMDLVLYVSWEEEKKCIKAFADIIAGFYSRIEPNQEDWRSTLENVIYPAIRRFLLPSKKLIENECIKEVTSTNDLFKNFERC